MAQRDDARMCWSWSWKRVIVDCLVLMDIVLCRYLIQPLSLLSCAVSTTVRSTGARGSEGQLSESWQAPGARPLTLVSFSNSSRPKV